MAYKIKKSYGGKMGGFGSSGYFKPTRDPMAAYKQHSAPESEYDRKVRSALLKSETTGPSHVSFDYKKFQAVNQPKDVEVGVSKNEVQELINSSLKDAFKRFVEEKHVEVVPDEAVLVAHDAVDAAVKRMMKPQEETVEQQPVDISELNETRQEHVNEKWKEVDQAQTLDDAEKAMSEIRDINSEFFGNLDKMEQDLFDESTQKGEIESALDTNPLLESAGMKKSPVSEVQDFTPYTDFIQDERIETKKRNNLDYDSELGW